MLPYSSEQVVLANTSAIKTHNSSQLNRERARVVSTWRTSSFCSIVRDSNTNTAGVGAKYLEIILVCEPFRGLELIININLKPPSCKGVDEKAPTYFFHLHRDQ